LERVKKTATGGVAPWPSTKYLNIWVANISDNQGDISVVAYATPPTNPLPGNWPAGAAAQLVGLIDGVVVLPHAVGSNNPIGSTALQGLYTKGRCLVHEVGHYLGLMHTFGSSGNSTSDCGTADTDDGLQDTPEQSLISLIQGSCPSNTKNSCGTGTNDQPDMWENYMDYTSDACQTMFTANQIAIMRSVMANQRNTLTSSSGIISIANKSLTVFPNPTSGNIKIDTKEKISTIEVFDLIGSTVLNIVATPNNTYDMSALPTGNYILKMTSQNGAVFTGKFVVVK
jgi:hypothetical protein